MNFSTRSTADGTISADLVPNDRTGSDRWWIASVAAVFLAACSTTSVPGSAAASTGSASGSPSATESSPLATATAPALDCNGAANSRAIWFRAADGTRLYGALLGSGQVGVVVANDVPHSLCETLTPARFLAARGYRVLVFDYRDRGLSAASDAPGRLDQDVAGAVDDLKSHGAAQVILLGSYAGVAAAVVVATEIHPPVDGVIGISPAAARGQWVQGPFGPVGAFQAAPRMRVPALYLTVRTDPYVSLRAVRRLYRLTASPVKDLVVIPSGPAGFYMIDFSSYGERARNAILSFVRRLARIRPS
jgi:pimeloyl-ACP methyl ester carboxylesterase